MSRCRSCNCERMRGCGSPSTMHRRKMRGVILFIVGPSHITTRSKTHRRTYLSTKLFYDDPSEKKTSFCWHPRNKFGKAQLHPVAAQGLFRDSSACVRSRRAKFATLLRPKWQIACGASGGCPAWTSLVFSCEYVLLDRWLIFDLGSEAYRSLTLSTIVGERE
jgi:hypothetical protein